MDTTAPLTGRCSQCDASLATALVTEVRHYEDTRLLRVTCPACETSFFAVSTPSVAEPDALDTHDVAVAAEHLTSATRLSDLFDLPAV